MSLGVQKDTVYGSSVVQFLFAKFLVLAQGLLTFRRTRPRFVKGLTFSPRSLESLIFLVMTGTFNRLLDPHAKRRRMSTITNKKLATNDFQDN